MELRFSENITEPKQFVTIKNGSYISLKCPYFTYMTLTGGVDSYSILWT